MIRNAARALIALLVLTVLTGLLYPLAITGVAQVTMGGKADGSLIRVGDQTVGSSAIGQFWEGEEWFHGRPSAVDYDASTSSGSNLGPRLRSSRISSTSGPTRSLPSKVPTIRTSRSPPSPSTC